MDFFFHFSNTTGAQTVHMWSLCDPNDRLVVASQRGFGTGRHDPTHHRRGHRRLFCLYVSNLYSIHFNLNYYILSFLLHYSCIFFIFIFLFF